MLLAVKEKWNKALPFVFMALFAFSRWPGLFPPNFSVAYAMFFCAGVYFTKRTAWWLPLVVVLLTDVALNFYYQSKGANVWTWSAIGSQSINYLAYAAIIWLGKRYRPGSSTLNLIGGGVLGALLFYVITNTASWLSNPEYSKTILGWITALTTGTKGWPQTWEFFRNTLLSGGLFTGLFVAAMKITAPSESPQEKEAGVRANAPEDEPEAAPEETKA